MNVLAIVRASYDNHKQSDFVVDGVGLGELFGFNGNRPWFGQSCFEQQVDAVRHAVEQLRGLVPATNRFGSARFALYHCHCGCHYCGIISCEIVRTVDRISWQDIRYEDRGPDEPSEPDDDDGPVYPVRVAGFSFQLDAYEFAIEQHVAIIVASSPSGLPPPIPAA